jgi:hypothetical protein
LICLIKKGGIPNKNTTLPLVHHHYFLRHAFPSLIADTQKIRTLWQVRNGQFNYATYWHRDGCPRIHERADKRVQAQRKCGAGHLGQINVYVRIDGIGVQV